MNASASLHDVGTSASNTQALRVGLIGAGMVAQVVHIPVLKALGQHFRVVAVCDTSGSLAQRVGAELPDARIYSDHRVMLADGGLDVVAVINSDEYHADCAIDVLQAGYHLLVEKPAALDPADVKRMIDARDAAGRVAMVGYMRRFAGAYRRMREELSADAGIRHVAVRDIIGPNDYFLNQTTEVRAADDLSDAVRKDRTTRAAHQVRQAISDRPEAHINAYRLLGGLGSHDLSALHGLVGYPVRVVGAAQKGGGRFVSAILDHGDFLTTFEMGLDTVGDFDASIEVFTGQRRLRIDYDTPFIRHLPTRLTIMSTTGDDLRVITDRPTYRDPYTEQWLELHAAITAGGRVETTLEDSARDLELFAQIVAAFPD